MRAGMDRVGPDGKRIDGAAAGTDLET